MSSLGINYGQYYNTNMPRAGYLNASIRPIVLPYVPPVQRVSTKGTPGDILDLREQHYLRLKQKPELGLIDQTCKRFGIFQNRLVQKAKENNPRIDALCAKNGISGRVEADNLKDVSNHTKTTAEYAVKIGERYDFGEAYAV